MVESKLYVFFETFMIKISFVLIWNSVNHKDSYATELPNLQCQLVKNVTGETLFTQSLPKLTPYHDEDFSIISENSKKLFEIHDTLYSKEKRIMQVKLFYATC